MNAYLFPALESSPDVLAALISNIPEEKLDVPTHENRFTPREVIAHLAEWEVILREERMRVPSMRSGVAVNEYDEGELAEKANYAESDIPTQLAIFKAEREKTIALLKSLSKEQLQNTMVHPTRGVCTVLDLANNIVGHDMYHCRQLAEVTS